MSKLIDKQMVRATQSAALGRVHELLESGASISHLHKDGFTALMRAAFRGDMKLVQFLLTRGADPNQTAKDGASPLFWASVRGHEAIVELLIAARADVNAARRTDENNRNARYPAINAAITNGHLGIAERLYQAGASLDPRYLRADICEYAQRHRATWLLPLLKKRRRRTMRCSEPGHRASVAIHASGGRRASDSEQGERVEAIQNKGSEWISAITRGRGRVTDSCDGCPINQGLLPSPACRN